MTAPARRAASRLGAHAKAGARWCGTAARACRYLWAVRAAVPWYVKAMLAVAMAVKLLPVDFGIDEALALAAALVLRAKRPGLLEACWHAARIRA